MQRRRWRRSFFFVCSPEAKKSRGDKARKALVATCKAFCCERKVMTEDKVDERNDFFFYQLRESVSHPEVSRQQERRNVYGALKRKSNFWPHAPPHRQCCFVTN